MSSGRNSATTSVGACRSAQGLCSATARYFSKLPVILAILFWTGVSLLKVASPGDVAISDSLVLGPSTSYLIAAIEACIGIAIASVRLRFFGLIAGSCVLSLFLAISLFRSVPCGCLGNQDLVSRGVQDALVGLSMVCHGVGILCTGTGDFLQNSEKAA